MDTAVTAWLQGQLGTDTNMDDIAARYLRLGSARKVAIEVLYERRADLLATPTGITVNGVVAINTTANLAGLERQIAALEAGYPPAPDDPGAGQPGADVGFGVVRLRERRRR